MVVLSLYKNVSDRRVLKKDITLVETFSNVLFLEDTSVINPVFDLVLNAANITEINYCYCAETKRYYYIDNITPTSGGRFILNCSVDVLMSYAEYILKIPALIYTQTNNDNPLLSNRFLPAQANDKIINLAFSPSEFDVNLFGHNFVLTSYRGGVTTNGI